MNGVAASLLKLDVGDDVALARNRDDDTTRRTGKAFFECCNHGPAEGASPCLLAVFQQHENGFTLS